MDEEELVLTAGDNASRKRSHGHTLAHPTGAPWWDVPERYGPWETVYGLFRRWQRDGTWHRIFEQLQARADTEGLITWDVSVDSTIARAHQHAAGARKKGICRSSHPVVSSPSPTTTGSDAPGAD
jgi:transposase